MFNGGVLRGVPMRVVLMCGCQENSPGQSNPLIRVESVQVERQGVVALAMWWWVGIPNI